MSRAPLMGRVIRLVQSAHEADARGISTEELQDERRRGISRRDFLATTGAAAAALTFTVRAAPAEAETSAPRIGIIGGGIAGLNAALTLQGAGYATSVFEAANRLGGRMHSVGSEYWQNGQTSEWCGELIDTNHKTILHLAQRFNLKVVDEIQAQPTGSEDTYYVHGGYYT